MGQATLGHATFTPRRGPMIIVVMGVAGSGKTLIGTMLARELACPFLDGDSLHPEENIAGMVRGIPLTDGQRAPWLAAIRQAMDRRRIGDNATFALTVEEQLRVNAALQDWLGEQDPD